MQRAELEQLLALDHEQRHLEVKGPGGLSDKDFIGRVARAAMAMGNLRDGGLVCIGVDDDQIAAMQPGLDAGHLAEWSDFDNVSAALARYSDPPVSFELHTFRLTSGADVIVLEVAEFEHDVHVCKKSLQGVLSDGHTYVRPRGQPRSMHVPTSVDMRELLNLAVDKGVREFVRRAGAAGIPLNAARSPEDVERLAFDHEQEKAWPTPSVVDSPSPTALVASVSAPAFMDVAVRLGPYQADRLSPGQLSSFVAEQAVHLRGWPVPMVDGRQPIQRHGDWVGQDLQSSTVPYVEAWRMCTSGQFLHRRVLVTDLRDADDLTPEDPRATGAVAVWDVLLYLVEVAELGARMATRLGAEKVTFDVGLEGIAGRELISGDRRRHLHGPYLSAAHSFAASRTVDVSSLLTDPRGVGVSLAQALLHQFGLDVPDQVFLNYQAQVLDRM